nr:MAG TPA: hypothetical protein [Caudoviricetes sp.]
MERCLSDEHNYTFDKTIKLWYNIKYVGNVSFI